MAVKVGDVVNVRGWTSDSQRARLKILAIDGGYAWARHEERGPRPGRFTGTHYTFPLDRIEAAPPRVSLKKLKAAMVAAHPDKGGSPEAFIAAREAYERAKASSAKEV
jgi:hypothetical protein